MDSPDRQTLHYLHIARFVIEAQSGFSIASGLTDVSFDNLVVRDANQLPAIPGTSIAGVIRSQYEKQYLYSDPNAHMKLAVLFGDHIKNSQPGQSEQSIKSCAEISWGVVHDSNDQPVQKLHIVKDDPLLTFLQQDHPIVRNRVRINEYGTVEDQTKFDVTTIPRGVRFSAEMSLWSTTANPVEWRQLCHLIATHPLRLGGSSGTGMGHFRCILLKHQSFNLCDSVDYQEFAAVDRSVGLAFVPSWHEYDGSSESFATEGKSANTQISLCLDAEDLWRVGQGESPILESDNPPDMRPYHEPVVHWDNGRARLDPYSFVVPGSAIKGVLRHRFEFHYARLLLPLLNADDQSVGTAEAADSPASTQLCRDDIKSLAKKAGEHVFGSASDTRDKNSDDPEDADDELSTDDYTPKGHCTRLLVSEARPSTATKPVELFHMTHTGIDRFTGGVRDGVLYKEELIWGNSLVVSLELQHDVFRCAPVDLNTDYLISSLEMTLNDLVEGRLALGGGSAKGHGYFTGTVRFDTGKPEEWQRFKAVRSQEVA